MALTEERRTALLAYCKLTELKDDPEVQALIPVFYDAAVGYLADAGVAEPAGGGSRRARYDLAVNAIVLDSWEHRDLKETGASVSVNAAFRWLINQLKLTEPAVSNSDTGQEVE